MPEQTPEQRAAAFKAAGLTQNQIERVKAGLPQQAPEPSEIEVDKMKEPAETPLNVPEMPQPTDFGAQIDANVEAITQFLQQPTEAEQMEGDLQQRILESLETLGGEQAQKRELEEEAGLPEQQQQLQEIVGQLQTLQKESKAIPLQIQQEFAGRGATIAGVEPIEAGRLRENAIKSLQLSAQAQTIQGNIALAQQNIDSAISAEFAQEEARLQTLQQLYSFNRDELERVDKKRSQQLQIALSERQRLLEQRKQEKEGIYDIGLVAIKNGAGSSDLNRILNSESKEIALDKASPFLQPDEKEILFQQQQRQLKTQKSALEIKQARVDLQKSLTKLQQLRAPTPEGLSFEQAIELRKKTQSAVPQLANLSDVGDGYNTAQAGFQQNDAQGDLAIVSGLARMLDPGSVVRPSEFESVRAAQGFFERMTNIDQRIYSGDTLKPEVRRKFQDLASAIMINKTAAVKAQLRQIAGGDLSTVPINQIAPEIQVLDNLTADQKRSSLKKIVETTDLQIDVDSAIEEGRKQGISEDDVLDQLAREADNNLLQTISF